MSSSQQKVIVIGAGIIGLMSALELLAQGFKVQIFDQAQPAKGASWAGGGILSPLYPWKYDPAVNALARYGKSRYTYWNQKLLPLSQIDFEIETVGLMIFDQDQYSQALDYSTLFSEPDQSAQLLDHQNIQKFNSRIHQDISSAVYFSHIANVRNPRLTQSILQYLSQHPDVSIVPNTQIIKLKKKNGHIIAIQDQYLKSYSADHYVLATGAWSQVLLNQLNIDFDVQPIHGQMVLYKTPPQWLPTICMNNTMYLIPRRDGHIVCGSSMRECGFNTDVDSKVTQHIVDASTSLIPELAKFPIVKQWAGLRPSSPKGIPVIGRVPDLSNMWLNVGHFRNGLVMAPASAQLLVQQMCDLPLLVDPKPYLPQIVSSIGHALA